MNLCVDSVLLKSVSSDQIYRQLLLLLPIPSLFSSCPSGGDMYLHIALLTT